MPVSLTITKAAVIAYAPELAAIAASDDQWTQWIAWAGDEMSPRLGVQTRLDRCGLNLVAHMATEWQRRQTAPAGGGGLVGQATSVKVGDIEKTFAVVKSWTEGGVAQAALQSTAYGIEYLRLIRIYLGGSATVSGGLKSPPVPIS